MTTLKLNPIQPRTMTLGQAKTVASIINDGAQLYKNVVPAKALRDPFVDTNYVKLESSRGIKFLVATIDHKSVGVMGCQEFEDAFLIRHAYVRCSHQSQGIAQTLFDTIVSDTKSKQVLLGCFKDARWAIQFYSKNGFSKVESDEASLLRSKYWNYNAEHLQHTIVMRMKLN